MNIKLGNLDLKDVINDEHLKEINKFLESNGYRREVNCNNVEKLSGNYHIYDIPRIMVICGKDKQDEFIKYLQENDLVSNVSKGQLGITYTDCKN